MTEKVNQEKLRSHQNSFNGLISSHPQHKNSQAVITVNGLEHQSTQQATLSRGPISASSGQWTATPTNKRSITEISRIYSISPINFNGKKATKSNMLSSGEKDSQIMKNSVNLVINDEDGEVGASTKNI